MTSSTPEGREARAGSRTGQNRLPEQIACCAMREWWCRCDHRRRQHSSLVLGRFGASLASEEACGLAWGWVGVPIDDMLTAGDSVEEPRTPGRSLAVWAESPNRITMAAPCFPVRVAVLVERLVRPHGTGCRRCACQRLPSRPLSEIRFCAQPCPVVGGRWWPNIAGPSALGSCHCDSRSLEMPGPDRSPGGRGLGLASFCELSPCWVVAYPNAQLGLDGGSAMQCVPRC